MWDILIATSINILIAALVLIAGWIIGGWVKKTIQNIEKLDGTLKGFLGGLAKYTIFALAIITVLGQFGVQTASMLAVLGAAGLAIGLALQGTLSNVAAGVMLLILRPFQVGDYIVTPNIGGSVKSLGLFGCELATADNVYVFVPNSNIWNSDITNYSRNTHRRQDLIIGISYDEDIGKATKAIQSLLDKEERLITTEGKEPQVLVSNLGDFSIDLLVRFWSNNSDYWNLKWDLTRAIKEKLDKEGITIPFPTQTVMRADDPPASKTSKKAA